MSLLISVLCENNQTIIFVSDQYQEFPGIAKFDSCHKYRIFNHDFLIGVCGNLSQGLNFMSSLTAHSQLFTGTFYSICQQIRTFLQESKAQLVEELILTPYKLTLPTFLELQSTLADELVTQLNDAITELNDEMETQFLLLGFDAEGGHITVLDNDGLLYPQHDPGLFALGTGGRVAMNALARVHYHSNWSFHQALLLAFCAKKSAETVPKVGQQTEVVILQKGHSRKLPSEQIAVLEDLYHSHQDHLTELIKTVQSQIPLPSPKKAESLSKIPS